MQQGRGVTRYAFKFWPAAADEPPSLGLGARPGQPGCLAPAAASRCLRTMSTRASATSRSCLCRPRRRRPKARGARARARVSHQAKPEPEPAADGVPDRVVDRGEPTGDEELGDLERGADGHDGQQAAGKGAVGCAIESGIPKGSPAADTSGHCEWRPAGGTGETARWLAHSRAPSRSPAHRRPSRRA